MRTRKEILSDFWEMEEEDVQRGLMVEVLLDIRDLLTPKVAIPEEEAMLDREWDLPIPPLT